MSTFPHLFVLLAMVAAVGADLVCPGYGYIHPQEPCVDQCSPNHDTCGTGKKCCYTPESPCGNRCLVAKQNVPKAGTCPPFDSDQDDADWNLCDGHLCDVDSDCPCKKKCCSNRCGAMVCIAPQKKTLTRGKK